jgi:hypothetical protein
MSNAKLDPFGRILYEESADKSWWRKYEYDEYGNRTYYEDSAGMWVRKEFDEYGNEIRYQNYLGGDTNKC